MRILVYFLLSTSAFGQTLAPPTVRDTYVRTGNKREVRLKDSLIVVVCKAEYDAWETDQKPPPALSLYMNGLLMKGPAAVHPAPPTDQVGDKHVCKTSAEVAASDANKDASDKAKAAKEAAAKAAVNDPDPKTRLAAVKDSTDKEASAKEAATKADAANAASQRQTGDPRYVMEYYLNSAFLTQLDNKGPWLQLLERPWQDEDPVRVSVGPEGKSPWPSDANIQFKRINIGWLFGWAALFAGFIILFVMYARSSNIIRDPGVPLPSNVLAGKKKAYSLARTQMAVWTFLVAGSLAFIFSVTWNENTITSGVLVLIGISFGTTLLAATADRAAPTLAEVTLAKKDNTDKAAVLATLKSHASDAEKEATATAARAAKSDASDADKKAAEEARKAQENAAAKAKAAQEKAAAAEGTAASLEAGIWPAQANEHFLTDLLTEGDGPSFHRYQMVLFTVILAVIFVVKTANALVMPEFDTTLLGLMGISSGDVSRL